MVPSNSPRNDADDRVFFRAMCCRRFRLFTADGKILHHLVYVQHLVKNGKTTNLNWLAAAGCLNHQHPSKTNTLFSTGETTALIPNDFIQKGFRIIIRDEETKNLKKWVNLMRGTILSLRFLQPNFPHPQEPTGKNPRSSFPFHRLEIGSPLSG